MTLPPASNETILTYGPGTPERASLRAAIAAQRTETPEIPLVIGGRDVRTGDVRNVIEPHNHGNVIATWHAARREDVEAAIASSLEARKEWSRWTLEQRAAVFLRAADLLSGSWRQRINAATMLNQSKTPREAEIDAACELIDFWRVGVTQAAQIERQQPMHAPGMRNWLEYRGLEGFVYAASPFNFTAIGGNLPSVAAIMGGVAVWKPSDKAMLSNYLVMRLLQAAGLPDGVINFVPGDAELVTDVCLSHRELAGIHFTGSSAVFRSLWRRVGENIESYRQLPRLVGETGGKDFIVAHASADPQALAVSIVRGAFEYQGQKCSAASRAYVPDTLWPEVSERIGSMLAQIRVGDPTDFSVFMGAVIDEPAFTRLSQAIELARSTPGAQVVHGGATDGSAGWFVQPTVVETSDPAFDLMSRELFGPVITVHPYPEARYVEALELCDSTSNYALTGAIHARDRAAVELAHDKLRYAAGNFYVNDKPTGSVVGQQPFGGARGSGTNDKAGWISNLQRWTSPRSIKETFESPMEFGYPYLLEGD